MCRFFFYFWLKIFFILHVTGRKKSLWSRSLTINRKHAQPMYYSLFFCIFYPHSKTFDLMSTSFTEVLLEKPQKYSKSRLPPNTLENNKITKYGPCWIKAKNTLIAHRGRPWDWQTDMQVLWSDDASQLHTLIFASDFISHVCIPIPWKPGLNEFPLFSKQNLINACAQ